MVDGRPLRKCLIMGTDLLVPAVCDPRMEATAFFSPCLSVRRVRILSAVPIATASNPGPEIRRVFSHHLCSIPSYVNASL